MFTPNQLDGKESLHYPDKVDLSGSDVLPNHHVSLSGLVGHIYSWNVDCCKS
jgi:hypothetical protein